MPQTHHAKVLIIGSGPAGYTAAVYAARAALDPVLVTGLEVGGQMSITTDVENYPGFADVIQGPWLMEQMHLQAANVGTTLIHDLIADVDLSRRPFRCTGDGGDVYLAETIVISTGAQGALARPRERGGLPGVRGFGLRDLRRLLLPGQGRRGGRRRQHGGRGGALPHQPRVPA